MQLLVLCATALLFATIGAAPGQQQKNFLELLKKDARELTELVNHHEAIGTSYPINRCSEPGPDHFITLCTECDFWRYLPGYIPDHMWEVKCQGQSCLNGFGRCEQQYVTVTIMRDSGQQQPVQIKIASGCQCKIHKDSEVLSVTALLFATIGAAPGQQQKSLLELLKKDARELTELVKYHENAVKEKAENDEDLAMVEPSGKVEESKRQLGTSYPLNQCTEGTNGNIPLCRECFFVRQLPQGYSPPMVNERKCQAQNCLQNYGRCEQQYLTVGVLQNVGTDYQPQWRNGNLQIASGCKCTLNQNGPLGRMIP
ncbi:Hypp8665 [Branchiostoma lanceolatum]|uniref:Hypp8665 protein n=1 Tax=Branchiostoma lanceolatum TaxID=7740 RepID=A0A8J9ZAF2_BRALA|nr:Hypp8665 [Branchiostoma lanceolatum]